MCDIGGHGYAVLHFVDVTVDVRLSYNPFTKEWAVWRSDETVDALAAELQDKI